MSRESLNMRSIRFRIFVEKCNSPTMGDCKYLQSYLPPTLVDFLPSFQLSSSFPWAGPLQQQCSM